MIEEYYKIGLESGLTPQQFWAMSLREVGDVAYAFARAEARRCYQVAALVGSVVANPKRFPKSIGAAFPLLFPPERMDWRAAKAEMQAIADAHNKKWRAERESV